MNHSKQNSIKLLHVNLKRQLTNKNILEESHDQWIIWTKVWLNYSSEQEDIAKYLTFLDNSMINKWSQEKLSSSTWIFSKWCFSISHFEEIIWEINHSKQTAIEILDRFVTSS